MSSIIKIFFCLIIIIPLTTNVYEKEFKSANLNAEIANIQKQFNLFIVSIPKPATVEVKSTETIVKTESSSLYWQTVYSVESRQGLMLYRPSNKSKSCRTTRAACGHHQLTVGALKDIGCNSAQCRKDRENFSKSLEMSKKLLKLNEQRLTAKGFGNLPEYQKYLIHQQGASGIKAIISASNGKRILKNKIKKNMANNSPYSYKKLKNMTSKDAANLFMSYWKKKWENERRLVSLDLKKPMKGLGNKGA